IFVAIGTFLFEQSEVYFLMQGGAKLGFANEGYKSEFNGYSVHFIVDKNFFYSGFLGLGLCIERFYADYQTNDPHDKDQRKFKYDQNMLPIFIDGRLPFGEFTPNSRIGLLVNAGYAPSLSAMYDKGFLFKGGFFYLHERPTRMD